MENDKFKQIQMIVFDVDGTLAETDDYYIEKNCVMINKLIPLIPAGKIEIVIRPVIMFGETILHSFYRLLDVVGLDSILSKIHNKVSVRKEYKYKPVDGIRDTLETLSKYYILGIITSGGRQSTQAFIDKYKLQNLVGYVISAEDCRYIKPHPMPLLKIAEMANVPSKNCLMIGDTIFDILCAERAGACSAAVKTGFDSTRLLKRFHADVMLESVNDLPKIMPACRMNDSDRSKNQ